MTGAQGQKLAACNSLRELVIALESMEPETLEVFRLEPGVKLLREWLGAPRPDPAGLEEVARIIDPDAWHEPISDQATNRSWKLRQDAALGQARAILALLPSVDAERALERERCAKIADVLAEAENMGSDRSLIRKVAAAIRAGSVE